MTIITTQSRVTYAGDGVSTVFPIPFEFFLNSDITAIKSVSGAGSVTLVQGIDYSLSNAGVPGGGSATKTTPLLSVETLVLFLNPPIEQESHYPSNNPFPAATLENDLDRQTQISQRLQDQVSRSLRAPDGDSNPSMVLPPASLRALQYQAYDASGNAVVVPALPGSAITQASLGVVINPITPQEGVAGVTPIALIWPELDVRRYGALSGNNAAQNATAIQAGISVLAQHVFGELLIPEGLNLNTAQVSFAALSQFNVRCDGTLTSVAAAAGAAFTNQTASQGTAAVFKMNGCTKFKIYGKGYINPANVDAVNITSCSDFDWSLDCRGTGLNSNMRGFLVQESFQFRIHNATFDSLTAQNFQSGLTTTAVVNSGATSATASAWALGAGVFTIAFSTGEVRQVTFGSGVTNVTMAWSGGLANNASTAIFVEIYYNWLDSLAIFSCFDFKIDHNIVRKSGANGIYILSVAAGGNFNLCYDFDVCDNICEFNAESGIQSTYNGGTSCPINYRINGNTLRYNQADGIDAANTGAFALIYAQFNSNTHINNGWISCSPSNPGGVDGSGIGTFNNTGEFEAVGNTVFNCNNAGVSVINCTNWRIANNIINKSLNAGSSQGGCFLSTSPAGSLIGNDVTTQTSVPSFTMQSCSNVIVDANNFTGGPFSVANGTYTGSKICRNIITANAAINWVVDLIDNDITLTGSAPLGVAANAPGVKAIRNTISAPGPAISTNTQNYCLIDGNTCTVSAAQSGILVNGSVGTKVTNNNVTTPSSPCVQTFGTCDHTIISGNQANNTGAGNSYSTSAGSTLTSVFGNITISGTTSYGGTFQVNFPA